MFNDIVNAVPNILYKSPTVFDYQYYYYILIICLLRQCIKCIICTFYCFYNITFILFNKIYIVQIVHYIQNAHFVYKINSCILKLKSEKTFKKFIAKSGVTKIKPLFATPSTTIYSVFYQCTLFPGLRFVLTFSTAYTPALFRKHWCT